ncbi:uncharacterized protein ACNLHF_013681 [Anomaloglossus baeobatrachus]
MSANLRATVWGDAEIHLLVSEMDNRDYDCLLITERPREHKKKVLRKIKRALRKKFCLHRSKAQIRKKMADLKYRDKERLAEIRAQNATTRGSSHVADQGSAIINNPGTSSEPIPVLSQNVVSEQDHIEDHPPIAARRVHAVGWTLSSESDSEPASVQVRADDRPKLEEVYHSACRLSQAAHDHVQLLKTYMDENA